MKQQVVIRRTVKTLTYDAFSPKCENLQILNALIDIATPSWLIEKSTVGQRIGPRPDFTHDLRITVENMLQTLSANGNTFLSPGTGCSEQGLDKPGLVKKFDFRSESLQFDR